jgi:mannonate dehydratase
MQRRAALAWIGGAAALLATARLRGPAWLARAAPIPETELSPEAQRLVAEAREGIDPVRVLDVHAHMLPFGGRGTWLAPRWRSHAHPLLRLQYEAFRAAVGVEDAVDGEARYVERLLGLAREAYPAGRVLLLAFDLAVDEEGNELHERSTFQVEDETVLAIARAFPAIVPACSVHPYRRDAVVRLERAHAGGARAVKWLANSQGIDPASPRCDAFYERCAALSMPLLSHAGAEVAVGELGSRELGNPLRLRRALDAGVTVVLAHAAGLGRASDLDGGGARLEESFDLCLRLLAESRYEGRLFADISALTLANRAGRPLGELLCSRSLQDRLVNGSDYPLPAVDPLISTWQLARMGFLDARERPALEEIFEANPLLFDFVLKRRLRVLERGVEQRFSPRVFESAHLLA